MSLLIFRLFDNFVEAETTTGIPLYKLYTEAYQAHGKPMSSKLFGKLVALCFPSAKMKRSRKADNWLQHETCYSGVEKCNTEDTKKSFQELTGSIPQSVTLEKEDADGWLLTQKLQYQCQGTHVKCEIRIATDLYISVFVNGRTIQLNEYGIWNRLPYLSLRKIIVLFKSVASLKCCCGVKVTSDSINLKKKQPLQWTEPSGNCFTSFHSPTCQLFIPLFGQSNTCSRCQNYSKTLKPTKHHSKSAASCSSVSTSAVTNTACSNVLRKENSALPDISVLKEKPSSTISHAPQNADHPSIKKKDMIASFIDCDHSYSFTSDAVLNADNEDTDVDSTKATQAYSHLTSALHDHFSYTVIHEPEFEESVEDVTTGNFVTPKTHKCANDLINTANVTPKVFRPKNMNLQNNDLIDKTPSPKSNYSNMCVGTTPLKSGKDVLLKFFPHLANSTKLLNLLSRQVDMSHHKDARGRRYDREIISLALTLWTRSPRNYADLLKAGFIFPSESTLSLYKNCITQKPGLNREMMRWMSNEAKRAEIPPMGYIGGLVLDEMNIQRDLQVSNKGGVWSLIGFPDLGEGPNAINTMSTNKKTLQLADHVLQFLFHGVTGFRMPFACYPTNQANSADLYMNVWDCVAALQDWEFRILYIILDGSSNNRSFLQMHFDGNPVHAKLKTHNRANPSQEVVFLPDPSHVIKKIRNSIFNSGEGEKHTRRLVKDGCPIEWSQWEAAFEWCQDRIVNPVAPHPKLTREHIYLSEPGKMRNQLAKDALDSNMLYLMKAHQKTLPPNEANSLNGAINLLCQTSKLIEFYNDKRPINSTNDPRLTELQSIRTWFQSWELSAESPKELMSSECRQDLVWMLLGFDSLITLAVEQCSIPIYPCDINSDIIENFFCSQRGIRGGNKTNPSMYNYLYNINSIVLGQPSISTKSNAGSKGSAAAPYNYSVPGSLRSSQARKRKLDYFSQSN